MRRKDLGKLLLVVGLGLLAFSYFYPFSLQVYATLWDAGDSLTPSNGTWGGIVDATHNVAISLEPTILYQGTGSLRGNVTWWGYIYKNSPSGTVWDFSTTPVLRMALYQSQNFALDVQFITTDSTWTPWNEWNVAIPALGTNTWNQVILNLNASIGGRAITSQDLKYIRQLRVRVNSLPLGSNVYNGFFLVDQIETLSEVPPTALSITISPLTVTVQTGQARTFTSSVSGGVSPYIVNWYNATSTPATLLQQNLPSYTFSSITTGTFLIYAKVTDYSSVEAISSTATITVVTQTLKASVSGTIKNVAGNAISGANVALGTGGLTQTTTVTGMYQFIDVAAMTYTLTVTATGYISQNRTIDASAGGVFTADFTLQLVSQPLKSTISGTVKTSIGIAIVGATLTVKELSNSISTSATGSYQFIDLSAQSYTLEASAPGYITQTKTIDASFGGSFTLDFVLSNVPGTNIILDLFDVWTLMGMALSIIGTILWFKK